MPYIDGYVIPIARKNLPAYWRMARKACRIWLDHGAVRMLGECGSVIDAYEEHMEHLAATEQPSAGPETARAAA